MNDTYLRCPHCREEMPLTAEDRVAAPMFVDLTIRLHIEICPYVDAMAYVLVTETETALRRAAMRP